MSTYEHTGDRGILSHHFSGELGESEERRKALASMLAKLATESVVRPSSWHPGVNQRVGVQQVAYANNRDGRFLDLED